MNETMAGLMQGDAPSCSITVKRRDRIINSGETWETLALVTLQTELCQAKGGQFSGER